MTISKLHSGVEIGGLTDKKAAAGLQLSMDLCGGARKETTELCSRRCCGCENPRASCCPTNADGFSFPGFHHSRPLTVAAETVSNLGYFSKWIISWPVLIIYVSNWPSVTCNNSANILVNSHTSSINQRQSQIASHRLELEQMQIKLGDPLKSEAALAQLSQDEFGVSLWSAAAAARPLIPSRLSRCSANCLQDSLSP